MNNTTIFISGKCVIYNDNSYRIIQCKQNYLNYYLYDKNSIHY